MSTTTPFLGLDYAGLVSLCQILITIVGVGCVFMARLVWANAINREMAMKDELTRVLSRRSGNQIIRRYDRRQRSILWSLLKRVLNPTVAVLVIDVDRFGNFNTQHGHEGGDVVLKAVAQCLATNARHNDRVIRPGGEEFTVLMPGLNKVSAMEAAERLRAAVEQLQVPYNGMNLSVTVSVGCAVAGGNLGMDDVIRNADKALYRAKDGGRNRVEFWPLQERE